MTEGTLILAAGALLAGAVGATLLAGRLRVPGLVLFLGLGMVLGSDGLGWIEVDFGDIEEVQTIGVIGVALILFEGGLAAGWREVRPVFGTGVALATVGTVVSAVLTGLAATWLLDLSTLEAMLLGSIVAATDSAAIFSVLRGSGLRRRLARTLEAESGLNDPVAVILILGFIEWIERPDYGVENLVGLFVVELGIGAIVGLAVGRVAVLAVQRVRLATTGLYPVLSVATAGIAFGGAEVLHGSGFLGVYLAGLALGSPAVPGRRTMEEFHAGVAWVSQIVIFLALGLLVFPSDLGGVAVEAVLVAGALLLVARPVATVLSTRVGAYDLREGALVSWAGLRGAVPVVFATFPVIEGVPRAQEFFNIVFFVVLISALLQGSTFEPLARVLGLTTSEPALPRPFAEVGTIRRLGAEVLEFPVRDSDACVGRLVNELGLPRDALVSVIVRGDEALLPRGSTEIEAGDRLHIFVRTVSRGDVESLFERWREGPLVVPEPAAPRPVSRPAIFTVRPWRGSDGDPAAPRRIGGIEVTRTLRTRRARAGALVQLEDGRYAVTGDGVAAVGGPSQLFRWCRQRIREADSAVSRAWWQEVAGVLSQRAMR